MVTEKTKILTAEQEAALLQPIDEHVGAIQEKINALRVDGTDQVIEIQNNIDNLKRDRIYTEAEKQTKITQQKAALEKAKAVEAKNKDAIAKLVSEAESYLKAHYDTDYY